VRRTTFTLVAIDCAQDLREIARAAGRALNVRAVLEDPAVPEEERARTAWTEVERAHAAFVLTDTDPLAPLSRAYVEAWTHERLERFDAAALELAPREAPDFYLLLDAGTEASDPHGEPFLRREWYLGVVAPLAPSRILPVSPGSALEATAERVLERLRSLPAGPPIPAAEKLVEQARRRVPGQR
jgi:hypothetical protein